MTVSIRRVAVTGASGYIGTQLIRHLDALDEVDHILATDIRPLRLQHSNKVQFVNHDVTVPMGELFQLHGIDAVAHLAFVLKPSHDADRIRSVNVGGAVNVMGSCVSTGVRHLVCLGSTTVYGAHADNPPLLTEESPLRPLKGFLYGENKAEIESRLQDFRTAQPELSVSVLRTCPVLGPNADNYVARSLSRSMLVAFRGHNPQMQFLHEDDMSQILTHCLLNGVDGTYNVAGVGSVGWEEMAELGGKRLVRLPGPLLRGLTGLTWAARVQSSSDVSGLELIRYPFLASTEKLEREHGLKARKSSRETWLAFVKSSGRQKQ